MHTIAVVVGEGRLPELIIEGIQKKGIKVLGIGINGVSSDETLSLCDDTVCINLTQIGKAIKACLQREVLHVVFAGRVQHKVVFNLSLLKMDWTTLKLWNSLKDKRTDTILLKITEAFEAKGIRCLKQTEFLEDQLITERGPILGRYPQDLQKDAELGFQIAKGLGAFDVGQSVVIKNQAVVAVEAVEGTNKCLKRAFELSGKSCVLVKVAKPRQDFRFDVPVIGKHTVELLHSIGARALVIESKSTLMLDKAECLQMLEDYKIALIALSAEAKATAT
ncbi:MAG: UDP-2,3-diacylglucosamine diphosphatase LpxI [Chlamydiales bacterium]|nr:UDP-2,3-diacylglucosamine diphosphatase LpxI [Chlamydiales bacterium]